MTRKVGYSLSGVPGARRGVGSDVVEVRLALCLLRRCMLSPFRLLMCRSMINSLA